MKEKNTPTNPVDWYNQLESYDLKAWEIAQKIHIGDAIPKRDQEDLRTDLYVRYQEQRDYFLLQPSFEAAVCSSMSNDIRDAIKHRQTKQPLFEQAMEPMYARDPKTGKEEMADAVDEDATIEKFFGGLDRDFREEQLREWHEIFREKMNELPAYLREFAALLRDATSQSQLSLATGISRKGCFLRRQKLAQIFGRLLREHRNIKALEVK